MARALKNVTVTLEEDVARWARVEAARRDMSVSRMLGDLLQREMLAERGYQAAKEAYLSQRPGVHRRPGQALPTREELHDRAGLR